MRKTLDFEVATPTDGVALICTYCRAKVKTGEATIVAHTNEGNFFIGQDKKTACPNCGRKKTDGPEARVFQTAEEANELLEYLKLLVKKGKANGILLSNSRASDPARPYWV